VSPELDGRTHGAGSHDPVDGAKVPAVQSRSNVPDEDAAYDGDLQVPVQVLPDAVDAEQPEYDVDFVARGAAHGFGSHDPVGGENDPSEQVRVIEPDWVYPFLHWGTQD